MSEDGEVHVESGTFRVDRRRALDKLMRFQLPQAEMFMLPWVRCAVASGATNVRLTKEQDALEMRFDGRPFLRQELVDPYSCLFDRYRPENRRNRELAIGLLSVLRLKPQFVSLVSGVPGARSRLLVESAEADRVDPSADPAAETVIKVVPGPATPSLWDAERMEWVERLCRVCPIPIWLSGNEAARVRRPPHPPGILSEEQDVAAWVTVPAELSAVSTLETYTLGVFVAATQAPLPRVQVEGYINDDQFTLSASQTSVARNARFNQSLQLVAAASEKLLKRIAEENRGRMEAAADAVTQGELLYYWRNRMERGAAAEKPSPLEGVKESAMGAFKFLAGVDLKRRQDDIDELYWTARATQWLRDAAARLLRDPDDDAKDPLLAALWSAPIEFSINGTVLSLLDLEKQRRRLGYVPVSQKRAGGRSLPFEAVWVTSAADLEVLVRRFPDSIQDKTDHLDTLTVSKTRPLAGRVSLEQAGVADVLARDVFKNAGASGEIGLALAGRERGARLTYLKNGKPSNFVELQSELRFDAALETIDDGPAPALGDALAQAAEELYPKLLAEYDCWKPGYRMQSIRDHLLDYLAATRLSAGQAPPPDGEHAAVTGRPEARWVEGVPLFDFVDSWLDFERLRGAVAEGRPVYLAADRSAALQLPGKLVLAGRRFTEDFLLRLLPSSQVLEVPGRPGLRALVSAPPRLNCSHAGGPCLAERALGSNLVHLAIGPGTGQSLDLPWGKVRAFATTPLSAPEVEELGQYYRLLIEMVSTVLKRRGTGLGTASDAQRAFLLDALQCLLAPWPGKGPARPRQNLIEFLDTMPLFRQPAGAGWTVGQVAGRLGAALDVTYATPTKAPEQPGADLILDEREVEFIQALFPGWNKRLVPFGAAASQAAGPPAPEERPADRAPRPEPAPELPPAPSEYIPPPHLVFQEPMLFSRLYVENGLSARIGLPAKAGPASLAVFRNGKAVDWPDAPHFVGAARVEIGGWKGKAAPQAQAVTALLHRFYLDLADHWPVADPSTAQHASAVEQILRLMLLNRAAGFPARQAAEQEERLDRLKMFRTLAGDFASLSSVAALAKERGTLPYAERDMLPVPEGAGPAPVLTPAMAKLLGAVLDVKPQAVKPAPPPKPERRAPEPAKADASDDRPEAEGVARARQILRHLRGRRGLKVRSAALIVAQDADPSAPLVAIEPGGAWVVQPYHPAVMAVLGSALSAEEQGSYLASLVYTAANRKLGDLTDQDDATFQQALADFVTAPDPSQALEETQAEPGVAGAFLRRRRRGAILG